MRGAATERSAGAGDDLKAKESSKIQNTAIAPCPYMRRRLLKYCAAPRGGESSRRPSLSPVDAAGAYLFEVASGRGERRSYPYQP